MSEERKKDGFWDQETLYETVMVAALEARRLNRRRFLSGMEGDAKVTTEAIRRAREGEVEWTREDRPAPPEPGEKAESATDEEHSFAD